MVTQACEPSTREARQEVLEFESNLGYMARAYTSTRSVQTL